MTEQLSDRGGDEHYRAPRASLSLADFELLRRIGDGSYSQVVLARHRASGREYALKIIDKHFILRHKVVEHVKRERALLDRLAYDVIVRLHFTFQDALSLYMGLEHCPNGELYDQIRVRGRLDEAAARFYAAEIVLMLDALRREGVVHRDLKPENLLLTQEGHLKLIDFGSAKQLDPEDVVPSRPPAGQPSQQQPTEAGAGAEGGTAGAGGGTAEGKETSADVEAAAAAAAAAAAGPGVQQQGQQLADGSQPQGQQQQQQEQGLGVTASSSELAGTAQQEAGSSGGAAAGSSGTYGESPFSSSAGGAPGQPQQGQQGQQGQQQGGAQEDAGLGESSSESDDDGQAGGGGGQLSKRTVSLVGTADYVSPEVLRNEQVTCAADLWALGCVLHQMLVGQAPFKSGSEYLTFQRILEGELEVPAHVPPHAADLIRRLLASDPAQRLGAYDLSELKAHPFFVGVEWEGLRAQPAPTFTLPELDMHDSDTGSFDWELQSLSAALPQLSGNVWQYESTDGRSSEED